MFASILDPLYEVVSAVLASFYQYTQSYAVAIALLTLLIMVLVMPLTLKSTKSMLEMQKIQPEVKKIQDELKGDVQARNEAVMALYKEHGVNPLGGCVPMLLPLPVFIVMYRTIHGLTRACDSKLIAQAKYAGLKVGTFCPEHIGSSTRLFKNLAGETEMRSLGLDLAQSAKTKIADSFVHGLPYLALVLIVAATSYYQQRQVTVRTKNQPVNPQQQMLLRVMPAAFAVFSLIFPAALIVYFLIQNLSRIIQNEYITRRFYGEGGLGHQVAAISAASRPGAGAKGTRDRDKPDAAGGRNGAAERPKPAPKGNPKAVTPPKGSQTPPSAGGRKRPAPPSKASSDRPRPKPRKKS